MWKTWPRYNNTYESHYDSRLKNTVLRGHCSRRSLWSWGVLSALKWKTCTKLLWKVHFASEGCCRSGFTLLRTWKNSSGGKLLRGRFCSQTRRETSKTEAAAEAVGGSDPDEGDWEEGAQCLRRPLCLDGQFAGALVACVRTPCHLPSVFTLHLQLGVKGKRHVRVVGGWVWGGLNWKDLRTHSEPCTFLVQRRQTKTLGKRNKKKKNRTIGT